MKKYWIAISFTLFVLLIIFIADSGRFPNFIRKLYDFPNGDKVGHFLLMGLLSYVLNRTALDSRVDLGLPRVVWAVSLILAFFVTLEELSQQFFPKRTFSLLDLTFSYAGIAFFAWLALKTKKSP